MRLQPAFAGDETLARARESYTYPVPKKANISSGSKVVTMPGPARKQTIRVKKPSDALTRRPKEK